MTERILRTLGITVSVLSFPLTAYGRAQHCVATPTSMTPGGWNTSTAAASDALRGPLQLVQDFPLPGPANRFDYQSIDPVARRQPLPRFGTCSSKPESEPTR